MSKLKPPVFATKLLTFFLKDEIKEEVLGDLEEKFFRKLSTYSKTKANLNYWFQVLNYFRPFAIRKHKYKPMKPGISLLLNYLIVSFRVFKKHIGYTLVNVMGLAIAVSCSFFIYLWVQDELKYNQFLEDGDQVFSVLNRETQTNGEINAYRYTPFRLKEVLNDEYPIVENAAVLSRGNWMAFEVGEDMIEWSGVDGSPEFFEIFEVPFIKGGFEDMYESPETITISESFAETYFGKEWKSMNLIGALMPNDKGNTKRLIGVYKDFSKYSTIQYDFVVPFRARFKESPYLRNWSNTTSQIYVKLKEGITTEKANKLLLNSITDHREGDFVVERDVFLQPFQDRYLYNRLHNGHIAGGRIEYVRILSAAAIFILLLACINFMNISTARSSHRAKETGVRKVLGARRVNLRNQFLLESILMTLLAVILASAIVLLFINAFVSLTGKEIADQLFSMKHVLYLLSFVIAVGILSGLYPAFVMSSMAIGHSLKASISKRGSNTNFRKALVVVQFSITMIMITGAVTVYKQVSYIQNKNIGLDRSNLVRTFSYDMDPVKDYPRFKEELLAKRGIESVTMTNQLLINIRRYTSQVHWEGKLETDDLEFHMIDGNPDFIETTRIQLKEGRNFSWDIQSDTSHYLINETAQRLMGLEDPIGKDLAIWGMKGKVIGVVKDFHNASLHKSIEPLIIRYEMADAWMTLVRTKDGMNKEAVESLEEVFLKFNPNRAFWFRFIDDIYNAQYHSEILVKKLSRIFTIVAIVISMLGLYALVVYSSEQRTKEVGIRKVLGASLTNIFHLLSKDYSVLLLISLLIAVPASFFMMTEWLAGFAYRTTLDWWLFGVGSVIALIIAYGIIGFSTAKVAVSNPVDHLRDE